MSQENVVIKANANLHHIAGEDLFGKEDERFKEYRRKWKEWPETFSHGEFPLFIDVEVTNYCNYRCKFCATTYFDSSVKRGFIEDAFVKRIIDEGVDQGLYGIKLNDRGEPLLHKNIVEFVKYAKNKGLIDVYFNTNAMLLDEQVAEALIDAGLDRISISMEGYTKDVYEHYRVGGNFEKVKANIACLRELRTKKNSQTPKIRIQSVRLPEVVAEQDNYVDYWRQYADEICFIDYKEEKDSSLRLSGVEYPWSCHQIWQRMVVWWDGSIMPCNEDDRGQLTLGNIMNRSIKSAWDSVYHGLLREKHRMGKCHEIPVCNTCYLRDSEIKKIMRGK